MSFSYHSLQLRSPQVPRNVPTSHHNERVRFRKNFDLPVSDSSSLQASQSNRSDMFFCKSIVMIRKHNLHRLSATGLDDPNPRDDEGLDAFRSALESSYSEEEEGDEGEEGEEFEEGEGSELMTGEELRALVVERWGRPYDTRILQRRNKINQMKLYLQVMWKFVGQKSFPLSEKRYMEQLEAVADLLNEWGVADQVRKEIRECKKSPVLDTTGASAVAILLDVDPIQN